MRRILTLAALLLALALPATGFAAEVTVSAAASLTDTFNQLKAPFEAANPGDTLVLNFAASGALYKQMEQGAPVDIFASADLKWMDKAAEAGFIVPATRFNFAENELVVAVPKGVSKVASYADLFTDKAGRIAVGTPETVPAGMYAKKALTKDGSWDKLQPKFIFAESVRQVLDYVQRGEVDAGFMYATDAKKGGEALAVVAVIPLDDPVTYPIAVLQTARDQAAAQKFLDFLRTEPARKILIANGFKPL